MKRWDELRAELIQRIATSQNKTTEEVEQDLANLVEKVRQSLDDKPKDTLE